MAKSIFHISGEAYVDLDTEAAGVMKRD